MTNTLAYYDKDFFTVMIFMKYRPHEAILTKVFWSKPSQPFSKLDHFNFIKVTLGAYTIKLFAIVFLSIILSKGVGHWLYLWVKPDIYP